MRRPLQLIVSLTPSGWQVVDGEWRLPASWYATRREAEQEAREYLAMRGGGQIVLREGKSVHVADVEGAQADAA
jgi:hypothetical protein